MYVDSSLGNTTFEEMYYSGTSPLSLDWDTLSRHPLPKAAVVVAAGASAGAEQERQKAIGKRLRCDPKTSKNPKVGQSEYSME